MNPFPPGPLRFREILVEKPWGGRRLASALGKKLPGRKPIGESWEVACREGAVSVVADGPLKGKSLAAILEQWPAEVLGKDIAGGWRGRFPLLVKFVDVGPPLSIQVHPSDEFAALAEGDGVPGKIEAWVVLAAGPKARLYKGLVPGMTREKFQAAIAKGEAGQCLNVFPLSEGDVILMPPGTVHAAEDVLFAEFQQNSDTTYRIDDWGRAHGGRLRPLQLDKGLSAIDYHTTALAKCKPAEVHPNLRTHDLIQLGRGTAKGKREVLVWCQRFVVESLELRGRAEFAGDPTRFYIVSAASGQGEFVIGDRKWRWRKGQTFLMPSALGKWSVTTRGGRLLWCYVP
jgi:mannose-6-phosphate isomerase